MKKCPKCNAKIIDTAKFCSICGESIRKYEETMGAKFCPECGTKIFAGDYCSECGFKINATESIFGNSDIFSDNWLKDIEVSTYRDVAKAEEARRAEEVRKAEAAFRAELANCYLGVTITFGSYIQNGTKQPIEWIVLAKEYGKVLLISKHILEEKPYNTDWVDVTWETCTVRKWLNSDFVKKAFTDSEQQKIKMVNVYTTGNPLNGTRGGNGTSDKVFLLSLNEAEQYFSYNNKRKAFTAYPAKYDFSSDSDGYGRWWLRSPGSHQDTAAYVSSDGTVSQSGGNVHGVCVGVRPVLWISI